MDDDEGSDSIEDTDVPNKDVENSPSAVIPPSAILRNTAMESINDCPSTIHGSGCGRVDISEPGTAVIVFNSEVEAMDMNLLTKDKPVTKVQRKRGQPLKNRSIMEGDLSIIDFMESPLASVIIGDVDVGGEHDEGYTCSDCVYA
ncbi:hypothetical protein NE237_007932 [Protea cynaroides]|uniref:Uncharacterized protein n=1 Tax=Protea cynaroides TaxID=273540 RepID=A0A9Q0QWM8_9MAGN|nr:hypothetical protein NE237_007932 [Protea cynaroides]